MVNFDFPHREDYDFHPNVGDVARHNIVVIKSDDLNKTIDKFSTCGLCVLNIGKALSEKIETLESTKFLDIDTHEYLQQLIECQSREFFKGKPRVVAIYNLGILLELSLRLDAVQILKELSRNIGILIIWEHEISGDGILHWDDQADKFNFNLSGVVVAGEVDDNEL